MRVYVVWEAGDFGCRIRKVNSNIGGDLLIAQPALCRWKYLTRDQASAILYAP